MTRALPSDLQPIVDAKGPPVANASLRLLRWIDWGDSYRYSEVDETAYLKGAINLFKKQAKSESVMSPVMVAHHARVSERTACLSAAGWKVRGLRMACSGRLRVSRHAIDTADPGLVIHRNLGIPYLPAAHIKVLLSALADRHPLGAALDQVMFFDAFPVSVPRLEPELPSTTVKDPTTSKPPLMEHGHPIEALVVVPGTEFDFRFAAHEDAVLDSIEAALKDAIATYGTLQRQSSDEDRQEPEIPQGPVPIASADGATAGMIARAMTVHYHVHNGRIVAMFRSGAGKDVKAEEHASNVAMTEEIRRRLAKKKLLVDVDIEVEAVGNAWRVRGIRG